MIQIPADLILEPLRRFAEPMVLIRTTVADNEHFEPSESEVRTNISAATWPGTGVESPLRRIPMAGGVELEGDRIFALEQDVPPVTDMSIGDFIEYKGERFRVSATQPWGPFTVAAGVREEGQ